MSELNLLPLGDTAITVKLGDGISESLSDQVVARARDIRDDEIVGVTDVVASYASVTVHYNPLRIGYADLRSRLLSIVHSPQDDSSSVNPVEHLIPVRYNGEDLDEVAAKTQLSTREVVEIHSRATYRVFVIGFVPGFAYLGVLDSRLVLPRRESPRKRVPAGSVAIAEAQTGIYPSETPGGWHLIGTTDIKMFDPTRRNPTLFAVGDRVRFEPA
jgi:inhibitor of KinA